MKFITARSSSSLNETLRKRKNLKILCWSWLNLPRIESRSLTLQEEIRATYWICLLTMRRRCSTYTRPFSLIEQLTEPTPASLLRLLGTNSKMNCLTNNQAKWAAETIRAEDSLGAPLTSAWEAALITVALQALDLSSTLTIQWSLLLKTKKSSIRLSDSRCVSNPTDNLKAKLLPTACYPTFLDNSSSSSLKSTTTIEI